MHARHSLWHSDGYSRVTTLQPPGPKQLQPAWDAHGLNTRSCKCDSTLLPCRRRHQKMGGTCGDVRKAALRACTCASMRACMLCACVRHTALQHKMTARVTRAADTSSCDYRRATPPGAVALAQVHSCRLASQRSMSISPVNNTTALLDTSQGAGSTANILENAPCFAAPIRQRLSRPARVTATTATLLQCWSTRTCIEQPQQPCCPCSSWERRPDLSPLALSASNTLDTADWTHNRGGAGDASNKAGLPPQK